MSTETKVTKCNQFLRNYYSTSFHNCVSECKTTQAKSQFILSKAFLTFGRPILEQCAHQFGHPFSLLTQILTFNLGKGQRQFTACIPEFKIRLNLRKTLDQRTIFTALLIYISLTTFFTRAQRTISYSRQLLYKKSVFSEIFLESKKVNISAHFFVNRFRNWCNCLPDEVDRRVNSTGMFQWRRSVNCKTFLYCSIFNVKCFK